MKYFILSLLFLAILPPLHASIDCGYPGPVGGSIGIPTEYTTGSDDYYANPLVDELLRVQIAWLPVDDEKRYRYQEVIDIDWLNQTTTQVDLYDGALPGIVEYGIREAEIVSGSNFNTGHLDVLFCMPIQQSRGLIFAHYGLDGEITKTHAVPFSWNQIDGGFWFSAVVNEPLSDTISDTFNHVIVHDVTDDVERATGVRPQRYLAESLIQQNLSPTTDLVFRDQAVLFGGHNNFILGNQIIITGDDASVLAVHSVNNVYSNHMPIMDDDYILAGLESHIGPISIEAHGVRRPAIIVDGRADFYADVSGCVDGLRQVSAHMNHSSELGGGIALTRTDVTPSTTLASDHQSISAELPCDASFSVESSRGVFLKGGSSHPFYYSSDRKPFVVDQDSALFDPAYSRPYSTDLIYFTEGGMTTIQNVDIELIRKIWGIDDLGTLNNGYNMYTCTEPGDQAVDSIDEIAANAFAHLTSEELLSLQMVIPPDYEVHPRFDDSDGDGSICNSGERLTDGAENQLVEIWLQVTRYLESD